MQVSRGEKMDADGRMLPNDCTHPGHTHGGEILRVGDAEYCLGCLTDACFVQHGLRAWWFTGSPYWAEILALGVEPLRP